MAGSKFIRITITKTQGSTPRDQGAELWVSMDQVQGSIGGGHLESQAILHARLMLEQGQESDAMTVTLGPAIGQCCGGVVDLEFSRATPSEPQSHHLVIFGAGHVGSQLARIARASNFEVTLIDNRENIEIENPENYTQHDQPEGMIADLPKNAHILILTHDHALDFRLAERALLRDDLGFIGMIGSKSKSAQFRSQFSALGSRLDRLHSPIGKTSTDKRPLAVALDILATLYQNIKW